MASVVCAAPGRSSHGLSTGISTPAFDCGAFARKFIPSISMTVSTSGWAATISRACAATSCVRASGEPAGSWYATKK